MRLTDVQTALLDRLRAALPPGLTIESMPDNPDTWQLTNAKGAVLVGYAQSQDQRAAANAPATTRTMAWSVFVVVPSLKGETGALALLDTVRDILLGWQPMREVSRIELVGDRFRGRRNAVWTYELTLQCTGGSRPVDLT